MGFFSNLKKKARKSIRTGVAPVMPRRGGLLGGMPQTKPLITDMRFRGRMPQRFTGLSGLFRRLQEQLINQQMRAPQPIPERMPVSNVPSFNPTIFGQPIRRDMDFSQMPQISPEDMRNLQIPTEMPVMPEERMAPRRIFKKPEKEIPFEDEPLPPPPLPSRPGFAGGTEVNITDFLNSDPQQQIFGIETRIGMLENQLQEALANNDRQSYDMIVQQINDADAQKINIKNSINPLRTSGRPELVGPRFDGFEEFITSIGPQNYGDYVGEPTLDDILSDLEKKN